MKIEEHTLPGEGFGASLVGREDGGYVVVSVGLFILGRWGKDDTTARDMFLVAGHLNGLKGKTLARVAFCGEAHVSRTLARYERGGVAALLQRDRRGPKPKMTASLRKRAAALRAQGHDLRTIAAKIGLGLSTVGREFKGVGARKAVQPELPTVADATRTALGEAMPTPVATDQVPVEPAPREDEGDAPDTSQGEGSAEQEPTEVVGACAEGELVEDADDAEEGEPTAGAEEADEGEPLRPGEPLAPSGEPHPCRYAGTMLAVGALLSLGLERAMRRATVVRPERAVYTATQAMIALSAAWAGGFVSLEAMHERDARSLGVVLGVERSPSVRTLWRAIAQMTESYDPVQWWAGWMVTMAQTCAPAVPIWGIDGHFKAYAGEAPIDKGYNTKRRIAERGVATVRVMDLRGMTWSDLPVRAGDGLREHVLTAAHALRAAEETAQASRPAAAPSVPRPIVLAFDRGGFQFDVLNGLASQNDWYLTWVPSSVKLPDLAAIAPTSDGVGEQTWAHPSLTHVARLLVQRDGLTLVPAATNLPPWIDTAQALRFLRAARGMEENGIKAARAFVPIDHLDDRGALHHRPDDRPAHNPARKEQESLVRLLERAEKSLRREQPVPHERTRADIKMDLLVNEVHQQVARAELKTQPKRVPRVQLDPGAQRAELDQRNRQLLLPLKNATENARRWLLSTLGEGLSPSAHDWDQDTRSRTLDALLKATGTVRFRAQEIEVTVELPLPPTPHARLTAALVALDASQLRVSDGRSLRFRLAPRPTRDDIARFEKGTSP